MTWTAVASLPTAIQTPAAGSDGTKLYVWGGDAAGSGGGTYTSVNGYSYDPSTDTWTAIADLAVTGDAIAFWNGGSVLNIGSDLYIIRAGPTSFGPSFLKYDPATDTFTDLTTSSSFPDGSAYFAATDGTNIYLAWQPDPSSSQFRIAIYDPGTNTWDISGTDVPTGTIDGGDSLAVFFNGSLVYLTHGVAATTGSLDGAIASWDPATDTWTGLTPNPSPASGGVNTIPGSDIVAAIGGLDASFTTVATVSVYDPVSDTWSSYDNLPTALFSVGSVVAGAKLYVVGGYDNSTTARTDVHWAPSDFSGGGSPVSVAGTSARSRGATATETVGLTDIATGARHRGASASVAVDIPFVVESDAGWEANGRTRDAAATIDVDDAVVPPPVITHHLIHTQWLTITGPPDLDANHQPDASSWPATQHTGAWGRYRIRVGGKDVTYFRGAQTLVVDESDTEPGGDDIFTVVFPMIGPFEQLGTGDLTWLPGGDDNSHTPVVIEKVDPSGTRTVRWEGDIQAVTDSYDGHTGQLQVQFLGMVKTLDERITKPRTTSDPVDTCKFISDQINYEIKYGWNGHGLPLSDTGILTAERGGYGDPLWSVTIQNLLAQMTTDAGDQYTITNRRPRGLRLILKDRATVDFTLWCGQPGVTHNLVRDLEHGIRAIYGEGQDHGTQFWRNTQFPNAPIDPPAYPLADGVFFNPGAGHTGFQAFSDELRTRGYKLKSQDTYLAGDEGVIRDFQDDTGATVDGIVGPQTWSRAFALTINANLLYSYIRPLAVTPSAEPFLYNSRGGITGHNPAWAGGTRRERLEQFSTLSKAMAKTSAKREVLALRTADFVGTVTATNIDPPEMCALDTRAGMNLLFKAHRGVDRLLHVAKTARNPGMQAGQPRTVTWTTSERGDDYVTLAARLQRQRDVVDQSGRTRAPRRGAKISPDFAIWDSESGAGYLSPKAQTAGLWNVYPVPAGERGSIVHVRLVANRSTLIAAAVFNKEISPDTLTNLPGLADPSSGSAGGMDPWQVNATYLTQLLTYADQPFMAWATGGPGAMQGYWPNTPAADATVTGVLDDAQSWPFHSARGQWLWLAVWTSESCRIGGDPAYDHRAFWPGADT